MITNNDRQPRMLRGLLAVMIMACMMPHIVLADMISENQVLDAAMQVSPDFQAVYQEAATAKADADQVARLSNPTVELQAARNSAAGQNSNAYDVEIEQPLKLSHLSGTRVVLSRALSAKADMRRQQGILQAFWNTKILYAQLWQLQEQVRLYTDFQKRARITADRINKSVKAGQKPVSEGSLFTGDVARFGSDLERVVAEEIQVRVQLEKNTGLKLDDKKLAKPVLHKIENKIATLEEEANKNASLVRLLESDLYAAEKQKNVAIADSFMPEIAPRFIYSRDPKMNEDSVGVGVVLTIPLWDRNQAERQKADADVVFARRQLDTLQTLPLAERLSHLVQVIERLDTRIRMFDTNILPNYRRGFDQAQRSFNAGQTDAASLWQIRERLFETEQDALNARIEAIQARRLLSLETGIMPQEVM